MKSSALPVYILGSSRTLFVKSQTAYARVTRKELMVAALAGLADRHGLKNGPVDRRKLNSAGSSLALAHPSPPLARASRARSPSSSPAAEKNAG